LSTALARGYTGAVSIEPHIAHVVHVEGARSPEEVCYGSYIACGRRLAEIVAAARQG